MKSKKLSNAEREDLTDSLVKSAFKKEDDKIQKMSDSFAESLYKKFIKPYDLALEILNNAGMNLIYENKSVGARPNNLYRLVCGNLKQKSRFLSGREMVPRLDAEKHKKEYNQIQKIFQAEDKLKEEKAIATAKTKGSLSTVSTTKQLSEIWPEAYELYKKMFPPNEIMLPDVRRDDLNKLLHLKKIS